MRASSLLSSSVGRATSKITPEIGSSLHEILISGELFVAIDGQAMLLCCPC